MYGEVFFDVETKKLFSDIKGDNPADLGVSIVSLYTRILDNSYQEVKGKLQSFWEHDFDRMWKIFQEADRIIGFNSIAFDVPALSPYSNFSFKKLPHFDIMAKVKDIFGKRISLDAIAKETLDREKKDNESLEKLKKYCEDDVLITRDIYDFVLKNGHLLFKDRWNTLRKVKLDFFYPEKSSKDTQIGLF